jgi:phenylacetyl-CoA:acceptor oxidoreductase subunit 2
MTREAHRRRAAVPLCGSSRCGSAAAFSSAWLALLGVLFLYCQGRILQAAKGIPAWREPKIVCR